MPKRIPGQSYSMDEEYLGLVRMNKRRLYCFSGSLVMWQALACVFFHAPVLSKSIDVDSAGDRATDVVDTNSNYIRFTAYLVDDAAMVYVKKWKKCKPTYFHLQEYYEHIATVPKPNQCVLLRDGEWIGFDTAEENLNAARYLKDAPTRPTIVLVKAIKSSNGFTHVSVLADLNNQLQKKEAFFERYPHARQAGPAVPPVRATPFDRQLGKPMPFRPATPQIHNYGNQFFQLPYERKQKDKR